VRPENGFSTLAAKAAMLNNRYRYHAAVAVLEHALGDDDVGRVALVSSFGAESVVLLHMISVMDRTTPVLFIDTEMLFEETLTYQRDVAAKLDLTNVQMIRADAGAVADTDPDGTLHLTDADACCTLRKTEPLERALLGFDAWITGRKRFQAGSRATLDYMINNRLPRHPLVARGYPSIGCAPCTSPVKPGEDPRAGRWRGLDKEECGIHFIDGKLVRGPLRKENAA
jgi:phosphoadenosine phosphosulfate reductase